MRRIFQFPVDFIIKGIVTRFVTASKFAREKLIEILSLKQSDVLWVLNTFEKKTSHIERSDIRQEYLADDKTLLIGCVGELSLNKGHHHLLAAAKLLKHQFGSKLFKLILIGEGPESENFRDYIIEQDISDCVKVIPYQWNIFDYYNAMDIYVHPSIAYDDLPFAIREAMSMGLPIIGSNFAGIPELVDDGINGVLVPPGDPDLLAKAIVYLVEHDEVRRSYGEASRDIYDKKLSPQAVVRGYLKLFNGELL